MYASAWATLAGAAHASMEYSPDALIMSESFLLEAVDAWALPPAATLMPQPPTHVTPPVNVRSASGSTPLVS